MNWKSVAAEDLEKYEKQKQSLDNLYKRINILNHRYTSVRLSSVDRIPVSGSAAKVEDAMLNNIVEREKLKNTYAIIKGLVELTEKGLANLNHHERRMLELFYIKRQDSHVNKLSEEFGYEKSKIYKLKEKALYNFTVSMYGLTDYYTELN